MIIKIKDRVTLTTTITDKEFDYHLPAGMKGEVVNIIELPDETLVLFHPDGEHRIYAVNINSVTK